MYIFLYVHIIDFRSLKVFYYCNILLLEIVRFIKKVFLAPRSALTE